MSDVLLATRLYLPALGADLTGVRWMGRIPFFRDLARVPYIGLGISGEGQEGV